MDQFLESIGWYQYCLTPDDMARSIPIVYFKIFNDNFTNNIKTINDHVCYRDLKNSKPRAANFNINSTDSVKTHTARIGLFDKQQTAQWHKPNFNLRDCISVYNVSLADRIVLDSIDFMAMMSFMFNK